ncbi:GM23663 [Drosophila sechellia]|uniref:GM23663 n=1 Tax=Drosophila sechellia TaxID=7238 RepID=B4HE59_DROSE|nr:GM23663 [Drosophila sechellia]
MAFKYNTQMILLSCSLAVLFGFSEALPRYSRTKDLGTSASSPSFAYAPRPQEPMTLTGNYNLIMPDYYDHHPAESMQLQNFANFYDAQMSPDFDLGMEESQFLSHTPGEGTSALDGRGETCSPADSPRGHQPGEEGAAQAERRAAPSPEEPITRSGTSSTTICTA